MSGTAVPGLFVSIDRLTTMSVPSWIVTLATEGRAAFLGAIFGFGAAYLMYLVTTKRETRRNRQAMLRALRTELEHNRWAFSRQLETARGLNPEPGPHEYYNHIGGMSQRETWIGIRSSALVETLPRPVLETASTVYRRIQYLSRLDDTISRIGAVPDRVNQIRAQSQAAAMTGSLETGLEEITAAVAAIDAALEVG